MSKPMRVEREVSLEDARETHPEPDQLGRFMRGELPPDERDAVVRHLLTRCPHCRLVTKRLWSFSERLASDDSPDDSPEEPPAPKPRRQPRRQPSSGPRGRQAARAALEKAAQELLLKHVRDLEVIRKGLETIARALPPLPRNLDPEKVNVTGELRAVIQCVLADSIRPAIANLRDAAYFPDEPPGETGGGEAA